MNSGECDSCISGCKTCTGATKALCSAAVDGKGLCTTGGANTGVYSCFANCKTCTVAKSEADCATWTSVVAECSAANDTYGLCKSAVPAVLAIQPCYTGCKTCE